MAKLSAHGKEIGRVSGLTTETAYMSDGNVMRNSGLGWKLHGKIKAGISAADVFRNASDRAAAFRAQRPAYCAYKDELHALAGMCKRWKLHMAVKMMPEDPDGVWSEVCDGYSENIDADLSDISRLCDLYAMYRRECAEFKSEAEA